MYYLYKFIIINIINLGSNVVQVLGPICKILKKKMLIKLSLMTSHMFFMTRILVTNSTIYLKISINVSQVNNMKFVLF